jgi:hypothetical protein
MAHCGKSQLNPGVGLNVYACNVRAGPASVPTSNTGQPMDRLVLPRSDFAGPQFMIPLPR